VAIAANLTISDKTAVNMVNIVNVSGMIVPTRIPVEYIWQRGHLPIPWLHPTGQIASVWISRTHEPKGTGKEGVHLPESGLGTSNYNGGTGPLRKRNRSNPNIKDEIS